MTSLAVREHVLIDGRDEVFLVACVDRARGVADLIQIADGGSVEEGVSLTSLRPVIETRSRVAGRGEQRRS